MYVTTTPTQVYVIVEDIDDEKPTFTGGSGQNITSGLYHYV